MGPHSRRAGGKVVKKRGGVGYPAPPFSAYCHFTFLALKNKKAGQARPFHPFFVNASTSVVKAFNGLMLQSASIMSTLLSRSGSAVSVNLWLTRSQRHYQNAHLTGFIRNTVEPYIGMRSVLFKTGPFRTVFQKKKAGKNPAFSFMSMTRWGQSAYQETTSSPADILPERRSCISS